MRHIKFFDTTLRDGEQAPGFSMKTEEKITLALQLERLGVDIIEAGFPATSPGDFEAVQRVADVITKSSVAGLCRANKNDIQTAWDALKCAKKPRIHIVIATSDIHLQYKLKKTREEALKMATDAVKFAAGLCEDIEFSAEDAIRSDPDYLCQMVESAIDMGASTVNIPDTVGYTVPDEFENLIKYIIKKTPNINKATISVHCHNDLGLAVANSLAAIRAGASQVECTVNGIGERAGNAALEEIVMMLNVRKDIFSDISCAINTKELYRTSRLLSGITGIECQPNKAVVGKNAFSHESGIHQDGVLKNPFTYEIMTPDSVGFPCSQLVLGKHSGRHAFNTRIKDLGHDLDGATLEELFKEFKELADKKKDIFDEDLDALVYGRTSNEKDTFRLDYVCFSSVYHHVPTATVVLPYIDGIKITDASTGDGPVDAVFKAIERISCVQSTLHSYRINSVTAGKDAQGEVVIVVEFNNSGKNIMARGFSTDVLVASAIAYIDALNRYMAKEKFKSEK
ncbi:MAG: 2-isopropylmalate synthase [Deferribacteraceae bacterium]|jgi:2-isopropylmalate synthase|nr:2-isopropylmalate synthase [Deferribacteraceae bacterium]